MQKLGVFEAVMKQKPSSNFHSVAEYFYHDAIDFERRFSLLWESGELMHKTGRIKSFTDLMMGCECCLKSHILLSMNDYSLSDAYEKIRSCGHRIDRLSSLAMFLPDRSHYESLASCLGNFPVAIRYSLDAHNIFFPEPIDRDEADHNYAKTIGLDSWVENIHNNLNHLNSSLAEEFSGEVSMDFNDYIQEQKSLHLLTKKHIKRPQKNVPNIASTPKKSSFNG